MSSRVRIVYVTAIIHSISRKFFELISESYQSFSILSFSVHGQLGNWLQDFMNIVSFAQGVKDVIFGNGCHDLDSF